MYKWTDDANRELENYLEEVARLASDRGDDPQEIVEGLRDHVTQEAETNGEVLITAERVRAILAQLGSAEEVVGVEAGESNGPKSAGNPSENENRSGNQEEPIVIAQVATVEAEQFRKRVKKENDAPGGFARFFISLTILDAFAAIFIAAGLMRDELTATMPSHFGNDLMPTAWHFWGLLLVPIAIIYNHVTLWRRQNRSGKHGKLLAASASMDRAWRIRLGLLLAGYVLIVSIYYMIVFVLMMPLAVIGAVFLLGLLPLSPYFTFIVGLMQMRALVRQTKNVKITPHWAWIGVVAGFMIYGSWVIHLHMCKNAVRLAISENPAARAEGIAKIKSLHAEPKILKGCYHAFPRTFIFPEIRRRGSFCSDKEFQTLYYRLTGRDYREALRSEVLKINNYDDRRDDWEWNWELENQIGGSKVGSRVEDLSLYSSTIDVVVAGDREQNNAGPCVAYVQWVLEFKNDSPRRQREARCQIQLPPGSVGSRLTLWIDDVEQEAAFGKRSTVKKAYKEVAVVQRRDPALLTTDGPDRLLLQCFPIEPQSRMKVKVGMSVPLVLRDLKNSKSGGFQKPKPQAILRLPYLADRNFMIAKDFNHDVWAEGVAPMRSPMLETEQPKESLFAIRGKVTETELQDGTKAIIKLDAPKPSKTLYEAELHGFSGSDVLVKNKPFDVEGHGPTRTVAIVVDTSRVCKGLSSHTFRSSSSKLVDWEAFFKAAPKGVEFSLFVGPNSKENLSADQANKVMQEMIGKATFDAADEQTGNLEKAWDACAKSKHGLVFWVHGPMLYELSSCGGLVQRMTRRPGHLNGGNPRIASVQIVPGPNLIEQSLDAVTGMFRVSMLGSMQETLDDLAKNLDRPGLVASRLEFKFYAGTLKEAQEKGTGTIYLEGPAGAVHKLDQSPFPSQKSSVQIVRIALGQKVYAASQKSLKPDKRAELSDEAAKLRLITPLTGAVVLESKTQYDKHGLDPTANAEATSDIPEPETWVLLIAIFVAFILMVWRQRQRQRKILPSEVGTEISHSLSHYWCSQK